MSDHGAACGLRPCVLQRRRARAPAHRSGTGGTSTQRRGASPRRRRCAGRVTRMAAPVAARRDAPRQAVRTSRSTSSELTGSRSRSQVQQVAEHAQHLPARARLAHRLRGARPALPAPLAVHVGAGGLGEGADRQHHVRDALAAPRWQMRGERDHQLARARARAGCPRRACRAPDRCRRTAHRPRSGCSSMCARRQARRAPAARRRRSRCGTAPAR